MTVERVLLIRHAQTAWNAEKRWQGHEQVPLNEAGRAQAHALAGQLRGRPIGAIYSSPLWRAWDTARALGAALNLEPRAEPRLQEINVGIFQGAGHDEIVAHYPGEWARYRSDDLDYVVPNGESRRQVQARAFAAWQDILAAEAGPEVALVSHGGTIRFLLLKILEHDPPDFSGVHIPNTSITTLERNGTGWRLLTLGDVPHFERLE